MLSKRQKWQKTSFKILQSLFIGNEDTGQIFRIPTTFSKFKSSSYENRRNRHHDFTVSRKRSNCPRHVASMQTARRQFSRLTLITAARKGYHHYVPHGGTGTAVPHKRSQLRHSTKHICPASHQQGTMLQSDTSPKAGAHPTII